MSRSRFGSPVSRGRRSTLIGSAFRRDAALSSFTSVGSFALALVSAPVLARALGPSGRGDLAAVLSATIFLSWLLPMGIPLAAAYFVEAGTEGELLTTATVFGLVVCSAVSIVLWFVYPHYLAGHSRTALQWARFALVILPLTVGAQAALEIRRRQRPGAAWNGWRSASLVVPAVGVLILAAMGRLTLGSALAVTFLGNAVPLVLLIRRLWSNRSSRPSFDALRMMFPYAWRSALTTGASSLTARLDQVVLAVAVPTDDLGLYAVAVTAASAGSPLTSGINLALFSHLRNEKSIDRAYSRFRRTLALTVVVSATVALAIGLLAPALLSLAFGARFRGAALPLRLLLPGQVAIDVSGLLTTKLNADGRPGESSRASLVGALITVTGLALFVPVAGISGAAAVTSLAFLGQVAYLVHRGALRNNPPGENSPPVETSDADSHAEGPLS